MDRVNWLLGGWTTAILLFLYLPIVILVLWSFNSADYSSKWEGFTTKWYSAFWHRTVLDAHDAIATDENGADTGWRHTTRSALDWAGAGRADEVRRTEVLRSRYYQKIWGQIPNFVSGIKNSLIVGVVATLLSVLLGTTAAWLTFKYKYPLHGALTTLVAVPMIVPEIIMGISLLSFITLASGWMAKLGVPADSAFALNRGILAVILAHVTFCFPYVMVTIQARLAGIDPALEEAAMDLGATPRKAFTKVIVPYLMPAIVSGTLMAFTLSLDDFVVTYFVSDADSQTLPIRIYGAYKGPAPMLHVVSTLMIGLTLLMVVMSEGIKRFQR
ncbi:MAG: transporter permease [Phycisphaerales bacterium]|nr:transporter permease [Phycisphaerales bacterium]